MVLSTKCPHVIREGALVLGESEAIRDYRLWTTGPGLIGERGAAEAPHTALPSQLSPLGPLPLQCFCANYCYLNTGTNTNQSSPRCFSYRSQAGILCRHSSTSPQSPVQNLTCFPVVQAHCPLLPLYSTAKEGRCDLQLLFPIRLNFSPNLLFHSLLYWEKGELSPKMIYHSTSLLKFIGMG